MVTMVSCRYSGVTDASVQRTAWPSSIVRLRVAQVIVIVVATPRATEPKPTPLTRTLAGRSGSQGRASSVAE